ncbi:hypothetical protein BH18VER1_BH18VER1_18890 [soil metagenome]
MNQRPFVIITTRLPPDSCGIGNYSSRLRQHWPGKGRPVEFLVIDGADAASPPVSSDRVREFNGNARQLSAALQRIGEADVLLHYAGRAYHRFGCPMWLPRVMADWRRSCPSGRLMVFFHELPGSAPLMSRHFWLDLANARIVAQLASVADAVATNTDHHTATLRRISGRADIQLVPVGSNIESDGTETPERVATEFVLFGLPFGRLQTLRLFDEHLQKWIATGRLTRLHIIGPVDGRFAAEGDDLISRWQHPEVAERHGMLASAEVARLLRGAEFALTNVTTETWSKSSAFMACAAIGCSVVVTSRPAEIVPLTYATAADEVETISRGELNERRSALAAWYRENADWPVIAHRLAAVW